MKEGSNSHIPLEIIYSIYIGRKSAKHRKLNEQFNSQNESVRVKPQPNVTVIAKCVEAI